MTQQSCQITTSAKPLERHQPEQVQTDRADIHLMSYLKNIMLGDIQELFQELAGNHYLCQRIQVNVLTDITEVGRIVRAELIQKFQRMAEKDARAEIEE